MPNSIADNITRLMNSQKLINSAIQAKGGTTTVGGGVEAIANDILAIPVQSGAYAFLHVVCENGSTITISQNGTTIETKTITSGTEVVFDIPSSGTYSVSAAKGTDSASDTITISERIAYTVSLSFAHTYGVVWDKTSTATWSNPQFTRTDESASFADPNPYYPGMSGSPSSPFDDLMPWSGMVQEIIDGNVLVKIPKFWYKITNDSSQLKIQISDSAQDGFKVSPAHQARNSNEFDRDYVYIGRYKCSSTDYKSQSGKSPKVSITRATARTSISNLGANYWQQDFATYWTIRLLYLVEFANWNSQAVIGYGCGNNSSVENTGASDSMPYHTGTMQSARTTYGVGTQYRWIEDLWGNVLEWVDGIYFSSSSVYIITDPSSFSDSSDGTLVGTRATSSKEIKDFFAPSDSTLDWAMYPNTVVSDSNYSTYVCDACVYSNGGVILCVSDYYTQNQSFGLFYMNGGNNASYSSGVIGTRLMYLP